MGIQVKDMSQDLISNVIVNSNNLYKDLIVANLPPYASRKDQLKHSNSISLIKGYRSYFTILISLQDFFQDQFTRPPLQFKILTDK